jgi:hypothetical protein
MEEVHDNNYNEPILEPVANKPEEEINTENNTDVENNQEEPTYTPPVMNACISADPLLPTSTPVVTNNQPNPAHIKNIQNALRSQTQRLNCPYCKKSIATEVNTSQNIPNTLFCMVTLSLAWCLVKCCQRKDFNCLNAEHKCPNCGTILANYSAC